MPKTTEEVKEYLSNDSFRRMIASMPWLKVHETIKIADFLVGELRHTRDEAKKEAQKNVVEEAEKRIGHLSVDITNGNGDKYIKRSSVFSILHSLEDTPSK